MQYLHKNYNNTSSLHEKAYNTATQSALPIIGIYSNLSIISTSSEFTVHVMVKHTTLNEHSGHIKYIIEKALHKGQV